MNIMPEFGTLRENEAAFDVAVAAITSGESAWGRSLLVALRDHICSTGEQKSLQWILPQVLEILEERKSCTPMPPSQVREENKGLWEALHRKNIAQNDYGYHP